MADTDGPIPGMLSHKWSRCGCYDFDVYAIANLADYYLSLRAHEAFSRMKLLLDTHPEAFSGAEMDRLGEKGMSALHLSVYYDDWESTELLLARGASLKVKTSRGNFTMPRIPVVAVWKDSTVLDVFSYVQMEGGYRTDEVRDVLEFHILITTISASKVSIICADGFGDFPNHWTDEVDTADMKEGVFKNVKTTSKPEEEDKNDFMLRLEKRNLEQQLSFFHVSSTNVSSRALLFSLCTNTNSNSPLYFAGVLYGP